MQQNMAPMQQQFPQYAPPQYGPFSAANAQRKSSVGVIIGVIAGVVILSIIGIIVIGAMANGADDGRPLEESIIGRWECTGGFPHYWHCGFTFDEDGRFVDRDNDWGDYRITGDRVTLDFDEFPSMTATVRVNGNRMTLIIDGDRIPLRRAD
jgi:hypothetical protein